MSKSSTENKYYRLDEFDDIKRINLDGAVYWMLSDLAPLLGYNQKNVIILLYRAMVNCRLNKDSVNENFIRITRIEDTKTKPKAKKDYLLTRYACVLLVNNGDQRKDGIAFGKVYFAGEPNPQDFTNAFARYDESSKRLLIRKEIKQWNQMLADAVNRVGVTTYVQFAIFLDAGYTGLYEMSAEGLRERRAASSRDVILEYMGSAELIINLLRISQTVERLRHDAVKTAEDAIYIHYLVGKEIRACLKRIGGTVPEDYPSVIVSAPQLEKEQLAILKHLGWPKQTGSDTDDAEAAGNAKSAEVM